jgi:hypothetical protein
LEKTVINQAIASGLHEYLDDIQLRIAEIHAATQETFINYSSDTAKVLA